MLEIQLSHLVYAPPRDARPPTATITRVEVTQEQQLNISAALLNRQEAVRSYAWKDAEKLRLQGRDVTAETTGAMDQVRDEVKTMMDLIQESQLSDKELRLCRKRPR